MEPITSAILFGIGSWAVPKVLERLGAKRAAASGVAGVAASAPGAVQNPAQQNPAQQPLLEPHRYPLSVVERFTEKRAPFGGVPVVSFLPRHVRGLRAELARRSVVQVPISLDAPDGPSSDTVVLAWHVVPRRAKALSALVLVDNAQALGATVVASHSLFFVADPNSQAPIVMLVGDQNLTRLAGPGGQFAVLPGSRPTVTAAATVETVASPVVEAPVAAPVAAPAAAPAREVSGVSGIGRGTPEKTAAAPASSVTPSDLAVETPPPPAKPRRRRRPLPKNAEIEVKGRDQNGKSRSAVIRTDENGAPVMRIADPRPQGGT